MTEVDSKLSKEERRKAMEEAEKAEFWQSVKALYIPFSLFIACCIFAAGVFLVYYNEPAGWGFIGTTVVIAISAFIALFRFQNKFRAKGIIPNREDEKIGTSTKGKTADKVGGGAGVAEEQAQ